MNKQKITAVVIILAIIIATLALLNFYMGKNSVDTKNDSSKISAPSLQNSRTVADPDMKALEADLNSINDEDFGDSGLSDSEIGL